MSPDEIALRRRRFAEEYIKDLNGTKAAIRVGYSPRSAHVTASRLLTDAKVIGLIAELTSAHSKNAGLTAERVLEEIRRVALSDVGELFDDDGNLLPIKSLPPEIRACIASVEVQTNADGAQVTKVRLWNKGQQLDLAARHLELLVNRIEVSGEIELRVSHMSDEQRAARAAELVDQARRLAQG